MAATAGTDLIRKTPEVLDLLPRSRGPMVLGNYLYADGGLHVRVSLAADALAVGLADRSDEGDAGLSSHSHRRVRGAVE